MANKQILAALQIESNEVRLVVGEIFNTRLNTLKKECVPCKGMDGIRIADPKAVAKAVKEAVSNVESHFGVAIESVLLAIPAAAILSFAYNEYFMKSKKKPRRKARSADDSRKASGGDGES